MPDLLILVHANPSVAPLYETPELECLAFVAPGLPGVPGGGLSRRYDALAASCGSKGGLLIPELLRRYKPQRPISDYDRIWIASWSAGYGFLRHLKSGDRAILSGMFLLDSGHTSHDPDGTASDAGVSWAVPWATEARESRKLLWIGHSDVDPIAYASTTEFAAEVSRIAGGPAGLFSVLGFDVEKDPKREHVAALRGWGPRFVHDGIAAAYGRPRETGKVQGAEPPPETIEAGLGAALLRRAFEDLGLQETRPNGGGRIDFYLLRFGVKPPANWCAVTASAWYLDACESLRVLPAVAGSAGAKALMVQFQGAGRFISAAQARKAPDMVSPGDLVFWHRGAPGAWTGHVGAVTAPIAGGRIPTIEANSGAGADRVSDKMGRTLADPLLLGFGRVG